MIHYSLAPICLFVYKRPGATRNVIEALLQNPLASCSDLHIFSDGPATERDHDQVQAVRRYLDGIAGFQSIQLHYCDYNKGLAESIISGINQVIHKEGKVIVLEDDLVVSENFLSFMNQALYYYRYNKKILSVSGYTQPLVTQQKADVYFTKRASSWGWATWRDRWEQVDWRVSDYRAFITDRRQQRCFNKMGSDLTLMLRKQMEGRINSWAIRWVYHQFKHDLFSVFPATSKVCNEGFTISATNTGSNNATRFATYLDDSGRHKFTFLDQPYLDDHIIRQFVSPYTIRTRAFYKLKKLLQF